MITDAKSFIFGGRAEFTIRNKNTKNEYKYKVIQKKA